MMKPEPSERASGWRGPWPGPGCWRGMKRRKNSSTSSSSIPGTWGVAPLRRTAWVVLMLTTALPWSSTRRVKSGSSRTACANALAQKTASQRLTHALTTFILYLPKPVYGLRYSTALAMRCTLAAGASPTTVTMWLATSRV